MLRRARVERGQVLLLSTTHDRVVVRASRWVVRGLHLVEPVVLGPHRVEIERAGARAVVTRDGLRLDLRAIAAVRVRDDDEAILRAARAYGADGTGLPAVVAAQLAAALGAVVAQETAADVTGRRDELTARVRQVLGDDLDDLEVVELTIDDDRPDGAGHAVGPFPVSAPLVAIALGLSLAISLACWLLTLRWLRHPAAHQALYVARMSHEPRATMAPVLVVPVLHRADLVDLRIVPLLIDRRGPDAVRCRDGALDLEAVFLVRVAPTGDDVAAVARAIGGARSGDPSALADLFGARFTEAIRTTARDLRVDEAMAEQRHLAERIAHEVGVDLGGHQLVRVALVYLARSSNAS